MQTDKLANIQTEIETDRKIGSKKDWIHITKYS